MPFEENGVLDDETPELQRVQDAGALETRWISTLRRPATRVSSPHRKGCQDARLYTR